MLKKKIIKEKKSCEVCSKNFTPRNKLNIYCNSKCRFIGKTHKNPLKYMILHKKSQAKKMGIEFNLEEKDLVLPEFCPILGIPLYKSYGTITNNSYSIDRIDPSKGYVRGNVQVISARANTIKNNGTPEELRKIADWMERAKIWENNDDKNL